MQQIYKVNLILDDKRISTALAQSSAHGLVCLLRESMQVGVKMYHKGKSFAGQQDKVLLRQ